VNHKTVANVLDIFACVPNFGRHGAKGNKAKATDAKGMLNDLIGVPGELSNFAIRRWYPYYVR